MPLPSWVGQKARPAEVPLSDSPWNAPGYRIIGKDFYTCVEPADRIADRATLRWLRDFAPNVIPVWRKQIYKAPGSNQTFVATHLCLAMYLKDAHRKSKRHIPYVEMPVRAKHPMPNVLVRVLEDKDHPTVLYKGGPGPYQPLTMDVYRDVYHKDQRARRVVEAEEDQKIAEAKAKQEAFEAEERAYRQRHIDAFIAKQLDMPGDDIRGYLAYRWLRYQERLRRVRRMGTAKPFIHVSGV